jgi:hypothetical protein
VLYKDAQPVPLVAAESQNPNNQTRNLNHPVPSTWRNCCWKSR